MTRAFVVLVAGLAAAGGAWGVPVEKWVQATQADFGDAEAGGTAVLPKAPHPGARTLARHLTGRVEAEGSVRLPDPLDHGAIVDVGALAPRVERDVGGDELLARVGQQA